MADSSGSVLPDSGHSELHRKLRRGRCDLDGFCLLALQRLDEDFAKRAEVLVDVYLDRRGFGSHSIAEGSRAQFRGSQCGGGIILSSVTTRYQLGLTRDQLTHVRDGPELAACGPMHGHRQRTHPFDPLRPLTNGCYAGGKFLELHK